MVRVVRTLSRSEKGCWSLTNKEALGLIKAAMIMINNYGDLFGSAQLLEAAAQLVGKDKVEDLMFQLVDANEMSEPEIKEAKAELILTQLRGFQTLKEKN